MTPMFAILAIALFAMAAFVAEGGRKLGNISRAQDVASEAARAGAATLDLNSIADGQTRIDRDGAQAQILAIVEAAGDDVQYVDSRITDFTVWVSVEVDGTSWIPSFDISGRGTHTAQVVDPARFG